MKRNIFCIVTLIIYFTFGIFSKSVAVPIETDYLGFDFASAHQLEIAVAGTNQFRIKTTGNDPFVMMSTLKEKLAEGEMVLTFDYTSTDRINCMQMFFPPLSEERSAKSESLSASAEWSTFSIDLNTDLKRFLWGNAGDSMRLDFGELANVEINIRNIRFRQRNKEEVKLEQERLQLNINDDLLQRNINAYLTKQYDSQITRVEADAKSVTIQGNYFGKGKAMLCEITPWENLTLIKKFNFGEKITQRSFSIKIDRYVNRDGFIYDRSLSKWVLVRPGNKKDKIISHARYVDYIQPKQAMSAPVLVSRKGLSYVNANKYVPDFDDLQLGVCSVNLPLTEFVCLDPLPNTIPHVYGGKTYYMSKKAVDFYDRTIMAAAQRNMIVAALVLVLPSSNTASKWADPKAGSLLLNKNCTYDAIQAMPNMTSAEAVNCYAAGMDFLASRYCRSDNAYGRVHHWVIHNEVDAGTLWTNMGKDRPMSVYMDTYYKSLRLCYQIAREYDAYSEVLASFTHSWTAAVNDYPTLDMIKELQSYAIEGDFHWGLAYHPYPEDLTEPKTWNDVYPTFNMNTPRITFKNLEVLDAWIKKPENKYMGTQKRTLWLAENGTNSKTYEGQDLQEQAAGLAYAWEKFKVLDGIDAFLYHAWIDNRWEFGLRIGLRRFDNDETDPGGRKPIWFVYQAAGTDKEDAVFDPYKSIIGISDWAEIMQEVEDK